MPNNVNCLLSKKLIDSRAKEDIVVNDPQKPTAIKIEYFVSRFKFIDRTEKIPIKLPATLMINTLMGKTPNNNGEDVILYLKYAPTKAPIEENKFNSFHFFAYHFDSIGRHYQHSKRSGLGIPQG
jgi:hypothetical protein